MLLSQTWTSDMKNIESNIGPDSGVFDDMDNEELPPIRSGNIILTAEGVSNLPCLQVFESC